MLQWLIQKIESPKRGPLGSLASTSGMGTDFDEKNPIATMVRPGILNSSHSL